MEDRKRQRCIYVTVQQKKKLLELMSKYPQLISCKVTPDFTHKDSQRLWENIANECNSIPGAKKSWRQWRKTWHDLKSKTKKRQAETNGDVPITSVILTSKQEELDEGNMCDEYQEIPEYTQLAESQNESLNGGMSDGSISELDSPAEEKVFTQSLSKTRNKIKNNSKHSSKHSDCYLNCDTLALQEQKKIQMKEEYLNFKKDYLRQKLKLLKEQTEALKCIANELVK